MGWVASQRGRLDSPSAKIFEAFLQGHLEVVISGPLVREIEETLLVDIGVPKEDVKNFISTLLVKAEMFEVEHQVMGCDDPNDDPLLEAALKGRANWIITKDRRLLVLPSFVRKYFVARNIRTIKPHHFLEISASVDSEADYILHYDSQDDGMIIRD